MHPNLSANYALTRVSQVTRMPLLVVDHSLDRLRQDFGVNLRFCICEKVDDFEYKIIQDINQRAHAETANTYYGVFVQQIPEEKGFILWLPGRKRYFRGVAFVFETGDGTAYVVPDLKEITNRLEANQFIYATYRGKFLNTFLCHILILFCSTRSFRMFALGRAILEERIIVFRCSV